MKSDWAEGGWLRGAQHVPSPNCDARPQQAPVDLLVIHCISLPPGEYGSAAVQQLFTNTLDCAAHPAFASLRGLHVSAHFFINRAGLLWQFVDCDMRAWHAGASCWRGRARCNDDSIGVELEGLDGLPFDAPQYAALAHVCRALARRYPIEHLAGHEHIAPGRKRDPGSGFDWALLQTQLAAHPATKNWRLPPL